MRCCRTLPLVVLCASLAAAGRTATATPHPPKTGDTHVLVSGAMHYGYTRKTASCGLKDGQLIYFAAPDTQREAAFPVTTGMLMDGGWHVQTHPPEADRDFEDDNVGGVVPQPMPGGNWRVELNNVKLPERVTMSTNYAYVNGSITCTSYLDLTRPGH